MHKSNFKKIIATPLTDACSGFSLVGALISVVVLTIAAIGVSNGLVFGKKTQNEASVRQAADKFQEVMRSEIAKTTRNFVLDDCSGQRYGYVPAVASNPGSSNSSSSQNSGGSQAGNSGPSLSTKSPVSLAFEKFTLSGLQTSGAATMAFTNTPVALAGSHSEAANRCKSPVSKGKIGGTGEYSYFCMNFSSDANYQSKSTVSQQSFWKLQNSFMEIMLIPVDLALDTPIMCQNMQIGGVQGVKVLYSIYYANKSGTKDKNGKDVYLGKRINGVFYVSGEQ